MRFFLLLFIAAVMAASCDSHVQEMQSDNFQTDTRVTKELSQAEAQREFAIVLSKVVRRSQSLRLFLKENAQKQFDNNYDVFYPYVKNSEVEAGKTFRQLMVENSSEETMAAVEHALPLLTIFIPDLSMFDAFDVNNWDVTQDEVLVSYDEGNAENVFFEDGVEELKISSAEVPAFPFLLVKSTNRMKVVGNTRANGKEELTYDYAEEFFKPQGGTRARGDGTHSDIANDTLPSSNYVPSSMLHPLVVEAYNLCKDDFYNLQRDYIYYGLSKNKPTNGKLKYGIKERLVKFKIDPKVLDRMSDYKNNLDKDPYLNDEVFVKKHPLSVEEVVKRIWHEGKFTIRFYFYPTLRDKEMKPVQITMDLYPSELFHIDRIHLRYKHKTATRRSKYHYTVEPKNLSAKWVNVSKLYPCILSESWDLSSLATNIYVQIIEYDDGATSREGYEIANTFEYKGNLGGEFGLSKDVKLSAGLSADKKETHTRKIEVDRTNTSDDLGALYINYTDKIIVSDDKKSQGLYKVNTYSTGTVEFMVMPTVE